MSEKVEKKEWATLLNARLAFGIKVDMTEFENKNVKAGEYDKAKRDYILSKLPADDVIKSIFDDLEKKVEALGYECVFNNVYSDLDPNPLKELLKMITPPQFRNS